MIKLSIDIFQFSKCSGSWIGALMQTSKKASFALLLLLFTLSAMQQVSNLACYGVSGIKIYTLKFK